MERNDEFIDFKNQMFQYFEISRNLIYNELIL
jgi:hypothetical protein